MSVARALFRAARHPLVGKVVGVGFGYCSGLLPVRRVAESDKSLAFYHPRPSWEQHLLVVPKHPIRSLLHLAEAEHGSYFTDLMLTAGRIARTPGWQLCANGGPRQEVQQVHFHLFRSAPMVQPWEPGGALLESGEGFQVRTHPRPNWEAHLVIRPTQDLPTLTGLTPEHGGALPKLLTALPALTDRFDLVRRGYTLFIEEAAPLTLHIVAGSQTRFRIASHV